jgi:cytoskeleton-associated protein 5
MTNTAPPSLGIKSALPSTFKGVRGGVAEDEELLAELRAISAKSSSADRFAESTSDNDGEVNTRAGSGDVVTSKKGATDSSTRPSSSSAVSKSKPDSSELPPWKRDKSKVMASSSISDVDIAIAAPPPAAAAEPLQPEQSELADPAPQNFGIKSVLPSTFKGDRGGSAEDEELLAELRAISAKSSGADRFAEERNNDGKESTVTPAEDVVSSGCVPSSRSSRAPSKSKQTETLELPPWKRGKNMAASSSTPQVDVVVATPHAPESSPSPEPEPALSELTDTAPPSLGIKSALPSTFKGDRGGVAEDEELLAELRAISAKSSSADRFAESTSDNGGEVNTRAGSGDVVTSKKGATERSSRPRSSPAAAKSKSESSELPPWKRGRNMVTASSSISDVDIVVTAPLPAAAAELLQPVQSVLNDPVPQNFGIKSVLPSTFKGDRGGSAEDEELLAELRAISAKSSSVDRFKEESSGNGGDANTTAHVADVASTSLKKKATVRRPPPLSSNKTAYDPQPVTALNSAVSETVAGDESVTITKESLRTALSDKSWKLRKEAYIFLRNLLASRVQDGEGNGDIDGETLMPGLDDTIPVIVADSNAGALDAALQFALDYAEHCRGASSAELVHKTVSSLVKGSAFSSSRPSTSRHTTSLTLKLMEVGSAGYASVHSGSEVLLSQGLTSRKPKVVIAAAALILQAAYDFGAGSLPLAAVSSVAPKMLSHSNATVRETGLNIVAESCRALGSKGPLQGVIDSMKKAQLAQLDSLLEAQPEPTPIRVGLRSLRSSSSLSPADAIAAVEAGAKELEAKRFAKRKPVNIFQELPKTEYSTRVKQPKWSEKVAALDLVLKCGGEKPYKLAQPTVSVNYGPLVTEMKKLLSHSHFAVVSKSMLVLSMLAEGVGGSVFPHLRPLLSQLILLSKDKKVNRYVGECLDSFFGNVLEIEHILDADDALPSVLNEKVQKNSLVRTSALQFLGRCIERRESAGPRGKVTGNSAAGIAKLCCDKLEDSDAAVRNAATESLRSLLSVEDASISDSVGPIIESLKSKNSRAHKSLVGSTATTQRKVVPANAGSERNDSVSGRVGKAQSAWTAAASRPSQKGSRSTAGKMPSDGRGPVTSKSQSNTSTNGVEISSGTQFKDTPDAPYLDRALSYVSAINVPSWDAPVDDGGVLAGLKCELACIACRGSTVYMSDARFSFS